MPWQVPITVDGLEYPVTFNTEGEPTQQDYDEAVQQILSQKAQAAPEPETETPGYLSQLGSALGLGYRQMKSGVGATFNALTGDTADVAAEMAEMSKLQREQQAAQTPEDVEFMRSLEEAEKGFEQAQGPLESIGALAQYPAAVFAQPGAAFKTAVQSAPNALISGATSLAGYGLGGLVGGVAGIETGPGAILTGLAGATAGGALSNTLMEAGPSIFDVLNERTQGAASNMTADEIAAYLQQNPDIVDEGLKTGAIRGSVIGAVEALGVKGSGRLLTMPERAAARAVQKELMAQGVDVASKEAVDKALLNPALRASTKAVAETAKNQFSSAGNMARLAGASAIETGAAGAGELAAQAAAGQDISTKEAFLEMMGDAALSLPMAATTKALEGAKYMLNPALVSDLGKASAENLAATGSTAAAEAQEGFNEAIELTMLPFTREDTRGISTPAQVAEDAGVEVTPSPDQLATVEEPWQIKGREWVKKQQANLGKWASDLDRSMNQNVDSVISSGQSFFGDFVDKDGNIDDGKLSAYRAIFRSKGKDLILDKPIGNLDKWKKSGVKNFPVVDFAQPQTPSPEMEMPSPPQGVDMASAPVSPIITEAPLSEGAERVVTPEEESFAAKRRADLLSAAANVAKGKTKAQVSPAVTAMVTPQPATTQENAPSPIQIQESIRQEPQDRIESREAEETGAGDQLLRPAEGEVQGEVITPPAEPTTATESMVTPGGVATERETDEQRFQRIKALKPSQRSDDDIAFANEFSKRQKELKPQAGESTRKAFLANHTASIGGRMRKALDQGMNFRGLKGTVGSWVENLYNEGWRMALDARGNRQFTNGTEALGSSGLGKVGMNYADFLSSQPQTTAAEKQTPVPLRKGTGAAGVVQSEPVEGSIPTVEKVSPETESESSEKLDTVAQIDRLVQSGAKPEEMDKFVKSLSDDQFNELVASEAFDVDSKLAIKPNDTYDAKRIKRRKFVDAVNTSTKEVRKTAQQVFQEEEAAAKKQEKLEQDTKSSLNSVVGPQKKNDIQGTVTKADVEAARAALTNSGEIPNAYLTNVYESREAFLADRMNSRLFPASYVRLQTEKNIEGLFENGQTLVFAKEVQVSDLDRGLAKMLGVSDEQAAARRVIAHENGHRAISLFTMAEKRELRGYLMRAYSDEQVENLVKTYTEYADWRTNPESRLEALEELLMRDFEKMEKIPTGGVWDDIVQFLKRVWRRLTGQKGEPTLKNLKDVVRLMRNAMKRPEVPLGSFRLKDGGEVKLSMIAPTAGITPEMDAEYLAAVEAGDMEKAQRMVDEAAKAAGYEVEAWHSTFSKPFTEFNMQMAGTSTGGWLPVRGMFFSKNQEHDSHLPKNREGLRNGRFFLRLQNPIYAANYYEVDEKLGGDFDQRPDDGLTRLKELGNDSIIIDRGEEIIAIDPSQIKSADPVTRDDAGNVIPLSQRFQPTSPDIRFSRPQFSSETSAAFTAGSEAARSTLYSERDMDIREAIRRAYEAMPKTNSVAVPIGELFAKTEELIPGVTQEEFSLVLQDLFEDNGAVLQEGEVVEPLTEQDRRYLALAQDEDANREKLQRMVDDVATGSGLETWFHGNTKSFGGFSSTELGVHLGTKESAQDRLEQTGQMSGVVNKYYVDIKKPVELGYDPDTWQAFDVWNALPDDVKNKVEDSYEYVIQELELGELKSELQKLGFDGIKYPNAFEGVGDSILVFDKAQIKSADPITRDDQGRIIPLSRRFDTGADIRGQINVTTPEGRRAGFVVVMPRAAKASRIPIDEIKEASKPFKEGLIEASKGREEKAAFKGNVMRGNVVPDHNVNATELYKKVANDLLDSLLKNHDILDVAESVQDPDLQAELGMQIGGVVQPEDILNVRQYLGALLQRRLTVAISSEKNPRRLRQLEMARRSINAYSDGASGGGTALNNAKQVQNDPELKGDFFFSQATREKAQKAKDKLDAITGGTEKITDIITGAEQKAADETTQAEVEAQESAVEDDEYAKLVSEGEEGLEGRRKTIWERAKMILRRLAMYARADKLDIKEGSKASLSAEQRKELDELNAILRMPKAERDKAREKDLAEFDALMTEFLGLESEAKTPEQKKTRKKREKMVNTAKKRAEAGKSLETPQEGEVESSEEQVSKAEKTAQAILKDLSERYSDPLIIKEKKPNVDAMRELYKERVKQGVGPNQMTEKSFVNKAVELGADETTAGILWKAAELEIDAREAMRQDKILQRKAAVGARADAQAHRIIFAKERLKRQSGFAGIDTNPNKDTIIQAFRDQVKNPVSLEDFVARLKSLNVSETVANSLFNAAEREKADLEAMEAFRMLEGPDALKRMLREMNKARPADSVPLERAMPWRKILSSKPKDVAEYRQRIFEVISDLPSFQNLTDEQKERLADLYTESWEARLQQVNDRVLREEFKKARDRDEISDDVEKKLQQSRNKILEIINLGGFNNDDLIKILGERYGISTEFTEEQKARIQELADQLQDETLNPAKRNKLAMEFAVTLAGASEIPVAEIIANWWTSSVLFGPQTIFSIGAAFLNGGYNITTIGLSRMIDKIFRKSPDIKGAIEESILMLQGIAKYLGAFKQAGRRAWSYLWTGNVDVLGADANDILGEINSLEELKRFKRHKLLAENLAKDPRALRRYVGMYLRFVNRLLTSLDAFNVMVTKAGTASLALRMSGMSTDKIIEAEKMLNLKAYKDQVIRDYFDNKAPKTQAEKALVDSYAEAEMYRAINKLGGKMENADYLASEAAMTMNPTGLGGFFYRSITGLDSKMKKAAEDYLEKAKKGWTTEKDLESTLFLGLAYLRQFAVQNLGGVAGYKFIRFASNKFNQGISYLPMVGLLRTLEAKGDEIKGKEAFIETIHRNQVIGAVLTLAAIAVVKALEEEPDDEERGNFWNGGWQNLTPDQKKQMLAKGQKEYTMGFKFNGRWYVFNYQNWPLNQVLAAIGSMSDQIRFSPKQWEEKGPLSKSLAGIVSGLKSTLEIPALSQLGTLVGNRLASKDPTEQTVDRLSNVAAGWVGGFVPRILKDLDFATQPELRKYKTLWEKTASHIPIYRRYVGEDYYDILGQPIKRNVIPGSREFMMGPTEPEYKILGALNSRNIFLTPANAEYRMVGKGRNRRRLTQEEADAYSLETGKGYRQMLLRYGQRALQMPTERARAFLSDKADEVRDRALKKVFRR